MTAELAEVQGRSARCRFALSSVRATLWLPPAGGWPVLALVTGVVVGDLVHPGPYHPARRHAGRSLADLGLGRGGQDGDAVPGGCLSQRGGVGWPCGWRGQGEGAGRPADLGGELLEAGRGVQREEPRCGGGDDVGVAKTPWQERDRPGPRGVVVLACNYPQFAVQDEEGLVVAVVDVDGAAIAAPGEVVGQGEGPPVCSPLRRTWDRTPRNQMAAWASGPEITLRVTGVMSSFRARGQIAAQLTRRCS